MEHRKENEEVGWFKGSTTVALLFPWHPGSLQRAM